jgi:hypothetical protein
MAKRKSHRILALDAALLGWEAQWVIGLRLLKLAAGGAAGNRECQRMISEKVLSAFEVNTRMASDVLLGRGSSATHRVLKHYRSKVRANRRRLTRKR